jgi:hypothetical protein
MRSCTDPQSAITATIDASRGKRMNSAIETATRNSFLFEAERQIYQLASPKTLMATQEETR